MIRRVLGIMSGTSLDGVDFVLTGFDGETPRLLAHRWLRFPSALRCRLHACAIGRATSWELAQVHHDLGRFYARGAGDALGDTTVDAVGLHGQTVFHRPSPRSPATLQLGEPAYLAEALRVPVVSNFRAADLAAGGQGAPLATLFHRRVFARPGRHVVVQNLGGIGNLTSLDGRSSRDIGVLAFDTGPANLLLDAAVTRHSRGRRRFDRDGRIAARGTVDETLMARWLRHPFFRRPPPKSTGREAFGDALLERWWPAMNRRGLSGPDRLATLTELTVRSIALNYRLFLPSRPDLVVVCGGGARNPFLLERLRMALEAGSSGTSVVSCAEAGWPPESVEGAAFALLARERLLGRPGNLPETTGATRAVPCGQV